MPVGNVRSCLVAPQSIDSQPVKKKGPPILIDGLNETVFPVQKAPWSKPPRHFLQINMEPRRLQAIELHFVTTIMGFFESRGAAPFECIGRPQIAQFYSPSILIRGYGTDPIVSKPL